MRYNYLNYRYVIQDVVLQLHSINIFQRITSFCLPFHNSSRLPIGNEFLMLPLQFRGDRAMINSVTLKQKRISKVQAN